MPAPSKPIKGFVVVKKPGEDVELQIISNPEVGYQTLRKAVEGHIECMHVGNGPKGMSIDMWINEEGKINGMKPNLQLPGDVVCGPILVCLGTKDGRSIPFPDLPSAMNIGIQMMEHHIVDPNSVEIPEPQITVTSFETWEEMKAHMNKGEDKS